MNPKGLLVDLDGTLYVGEEPVVGAHEAVERLLTVGLAIRYVTNTTRKPRCEVVAGLSEMGFPAHEEHAFTPVAQRLRGRKVHALVAEPRLKDLCPRPNRTTSRVLAHRRPQHRHRRLAGRAGPDRQEPAWGGGERGPRS